MLTRRLRGASRTVCVCVLSRCDTNRLCPAVTFKRDTLAPVAQRGRFASSPTHSRSAYKREFFASPVLYKRHGFFFFFFVNAALSQARCRGDCIVSNLSPTTLLLLLETFSILGVLSFPGDGTPGMLKVSVVSGAAATTPSRTLFNLWLAKRQQPRKCDDTRDVTSVPGPRVRGARSFNCNDGRIIHRGDAGWEVLGLP